MNADLRDSDLRKQPRHPIVAAIAVVVREEEIILVRRANPPDAGLWGFPGGKIGLGEHVNEAAARELYEETRVSARPIEAFTAVDAIEAGEGPLPSHHYVLVAVLCEWIGGDPVAHDDALEARWFKISDLLSGDTVKSFAVDIVAVKALALARSLARPLELPAGSSSPPLA
jgi:8-oxo-dGTP diphosphatase